MKKILLTLSMTALLLFTAGCSCPFSDKTADSKPHKNPPAASAAQTPPDVSYPALGSGNPLRQSALKGKPVFINFWATWCPPCVGELPHIEKKYAEYKDKMHFVILSVDDNEQDPARFIQSKGYTFPAAYGDHQALGRAYGIDAIPASYIISADGRIVASTVGSMNESSLDAFLQKAF